MKLEMIILPVLFVCRFSFIRCLKETNILDCKFVIRLTIFICSFLSLLSYIVSVSLVMRTKIIASSDLRNLFMIIRLSLFFNRYSVRIKAS
jgi:hypothetical protein